MDANVKDRKQGSDLQYIRGGARWAANGMVMGVTGLIFDSMA